MTESKSSALPSSLRRANERTLISHLVRMGAATRAQLARAAHVSQPTCGKIVDDLIRIGIAREADFDEPEETARVGRPGRVVRLNATEPRFLVIQLDVLETSFAMAPVSAPLEDRWQAVCPTTTSAEQWAGEVRRIARELRIDGLWGVLVSVPGIVNEAAGKVLFSPNLHWSEHASLPALLSEIWGAPILLVQENRAAALGHRAARQELRDFLLVDFGQGVGGAIIEGGRLFSSPLPLNSEFGHTPIPGNHRQCGCGATGCLETRLSRSGLLRSFAEANRGQPEGWPVLLAHVREHGVRPWLAEDLTASASVIAGALNVLGLRHVVVTGSLNELPPGVIGRLEEGIREGSLWGRFGDVTCEGAPRRRIAGLVAAAIDRWLVPADGRGVLRARRRPQQAKPAPDTLRNRREREMLSGGLEQPLTSARS